MFFPYKSPGNDVVNMLRIRTTMSAVTPEIVPPTVHTRIVPGTSNFPKRLITQKPESFGRESPMPPAQIASAASSGDTPSRPVTTGAKIAAVVTSATVVEPCAARST